MNRPEATRIRVLPGALHIRHTHNPAEMVFSRGQPSWGMHLADDLERLVTLHDSSNIAALIVEPVAGSTGILVPPVGYLERLREICNKFGILLIFDEVITAFGRLGGAFSSDRFGVIPDIITTAKGLTNGVVPMGAVLVKDKIYKALMQGPEGGIELFHGYTYSAHPLAVAAALATLDTYVKEDSFARARNTEKPFEQLIHSLKGEPHVLDIRNCGLMGGIDLQPRAGAPGARGSEAFARCWANGVVIRSGGDTLQFSPFLDSPTDELERVFSTVRDALRAIT